MAYETAVAVIGVGGLFSLLFLGVNTDGAKHPAPKLLYILMTLWFVVALLGLSNQIAIGDAAPDAVINAINAIYKASIIISLIMTFYYVIYFIKSLMEWISSSWNAKRNKKIEM